MLNAGHAVQATWGLSCTMWGFGCRYQCGAWFFDISIGLQVSKCGASGVEWGASGVENGGGLRCRYHYGASFFDINIGPQMYNVGLQMYNAGHQMSHMSNMGPEV